ncbi:MAG: IS5 family transposase [Verrucomicrobiae bacterium]|nr:IS5 family transposase [Verrucomicrobiae bacterium]
MDGTLDGLWWLLRTGSMWSELPPEYGKWNSIWRMFRRWCDRGLWAGVLARLAEEHPRYAVMLAVDTTHIKAHQDATRSPLSVEEQKLGKTKGGRNTKLSAVVNLTGRAVALRLVCGQEHDSRSALDTLPASLEGSFVLADKAYDSDRLRVEIARRGGLPVIPPKANRINPPPYDKETGRLRHKVENLFCRLKRFRRVGTRYDQRADTYLGFVTLSAIIDWLRSPFVHTA